MINESKHALKKKTHTPPSLIKIISMHVAIINKLETANSQKNPEKISPAPRSSMQLFSLGCCFDSVIQYVRRITCTLTAPALNSRSTSLESSC